jgi:hypothetical protein
MANFSDWLFGSPDRLEKFETGTPEQQALHNNILAQAMGMTQDGGGYRQAQDYYNSLFQPGNKAYENFAAPYMNQFQEQVLPQIAERFAGAGALSSSGFGQALGGAGAGLQAQLAQLFASLQSQAAANQTNQFNQLSQTGLNYQPFGYHETPGSSGFLGPLLGGIGTAMGGPIGSALGSGIGAGISSLFKKPSGTSGLTSRGINEAFRNMGNAGLSGGFF